MGLCAVQFLLNQAIILQPIWMQLCNLLFVISCVIERLCNSLAASSQWQFCHFGGQWRIKFRFLCGGNSVILVVDQVLGFDFQTSCAKSQLGMRFRDRLQNSTLSSDSFTKAIILIRVIVLLKCSPSLQPFVCLNPALHPIFFLPFSFLFFSFFLLPIFFSKLQLVSCPCSLI